ncbi:MAG: nucleotidyltransferase family protein [Candidatus Taylorbacteria bacterium]|nr:nucleotidyltransferase family protein [Candidatus Taylorbacteria bacterium]
MKAVILCAGLGTRLLPLTKDIPKVMVEIGGKPLLQHHIEWLAKEGIREIGINLFYLPEVVPSYFGNGSKFGVNIHYSHQSTLSETASGFKRFEKFADGERCVVIYGDNIFQLDLKDLELFHEKKGGIATITLREWENPTAKGIVEMDNNYRILKFKEKPKAEEVTTNLGNAGVYIFESKLFDYIPTDKDYDFGKDIFPKLLEENQNLYGYRLHGYHLDIGTLEMLEKARKDFNQYEDLV